MNYLESLVEELVASMVEMLFLWGETCLDRESMLACLRTSKSLAWGSSMYCIVLIYGFSPISLVISNGFWPF